MNILQIAIPALCICFLCTSCETDQKTEDMSEMYARAVSQDMKPPAARKIEKKLEMHGHVRIDQYYWLNERDNPEVTAHLEAENAYRESVMSHLREYQDELYEEIKGRIKQTDMSVPYRYHGYYYFTRYEEGLEYPVHSRKRASLDASEEIMLDVNAMARGYDYYAVGGREVSPDNTVLAYGEDTLSRRIYTLRFKDLETGEHFPESIHNTTGYAVWAADNRTVFYVTKDPNTLRPEKIWRHVLGTDPSEDVMIYHETDETFMPFIYKTKSEKYLVQGSYHTLSREYRILEANNLTGEFRVFEPRRRDLEYSIDHYGDKFYIVTNLDARNFRLMECPESATRQQYWQEVIGHRDDVLLEGIEIFRDFLVLSERKYGITQLRVRPWNGDEHYIDFGEDAYVAYVSINPEFDTELLRIGYQSMTTPNTTYDYNMRTRHREMLKQEEVLGGFDPSNYRSERVFVRARDGVEIPVSIVYHKDTPMDGTAPCLEYGYGSYGASMNPYFSHARLSLLDRGFVWAIAHIRGGEEMGRHWYEDGKKLNKKNTFNDFIDCGRYLVEKGYSAKDHLYAMGGSAGGLLVGAAINMETGLYKGVIAAVPFVDVVTTMLDPSIPLTTGEYDEWGDPNDKKFYEYILTYSPYDNVAHQDYPAMLVTTGFHDSQVQYWEPAKWVAKLREYKTDNNPMLLYCNMETGHGGASGRFERFREVAMEYAFLLDLAGKNQ